MLWKNVVCVQKYFWRLLECCFHADRSHASHEADDWNINRNWRHRSFVGPSVTQSIHEVQTECNLSMTTKQQPLTRLNQQLTRLDRFFLLSFPPPCSMIIIIIIPWPLPAFKSSRSTNYRWIQIDMATKNIIYVCKNHSRAHLPSTGLSWLLQPDGRPPLPKSSSCRWSSLLCLLSSRLLFLIMK